MMQGTRAGFTVPDNSGFYQVFGINTSQDISSWSAVGYIYNPSDPKIALDAFDISINSSTNRLTAELSLTDNAALLPSGETSIDLRYCILVDPNLGYGLRMFYGDYKVTQGGPAS